MSYLCPRILTPKPTYTTQAVPPPINDKKAVTLSLMR